MMQHFENTLDEIARAGNLRSIPTTAGEAGYVDLTSNDYMGIAADRRLFDEFVAACDFSKVYPSASASRLLSLHQDDFLALESLLASLYGREALLFNSGYHANTGIVSAIADKDTVIIADKLVHASIIDGIILSRARFVRFRHNDFDQLEKLLTEHSHQAQRLLVIVESIYSMDGDIADLPRLVELKRKFPQMLLYVDEAHGFGVRGRQGLGVAEETGTIPDIDILVGTLGKAAASSGAFVITSEIIKKFLINKARSFIFSTALSPFSCLWSKFVIEKLVGMHEERRQLLAVSNFLNENFARYNGNIRSHSQIVPLIVGDSRKAVELSGFLKEHHILALPIRRPTVPPGTERIRFSISTRFTMEMAEKLTNIINMYL